jgi:hypothetical protein
VRAYRRDLVERRRPFRIRLNRNPEEVPDRSVSVARFGYRERPLLGEVKAFPDRHRRP